MKNNGIILLCILVFVVSLVVGILLGISIERYTELTHAIAAIPKP